jgi:VanZ family protein
MTSRLVTRKQAATLNVPANVGSSGDQKLRLDHTVTNNVLRVAAWLLVATIAALSLVPPSWRPVTGAGHGLEHIAIFLATGLAFGLGYHTRHGSQAIALAAFAGLVEMTQHFVPGRHARMSDFVIDAASACIGVAVALVTTRMMRSSG